MGCDTDGAQEVRLLVGDNGVGLPADLDIEHVETLGLTLVQMLCEQLQARLVVRRQATRLGISTGVEFEIRFATGNGREHSEEAR